MFQVVQDAPGIGHATGTMIAGVSKELIAFGFIGRPAEPQLRKSAVRTARLEDGPRLRIIVLGIATKNIGRGNRQRTVDNDGNRRNPSR